MNEFNNLSANNYPDKDTFFYYLGKNLVSPRLNLYDPVIEVMKKANENLANSLIAEVYKLEQIFNQKNIIEFQWHQIELKLTFEQKKKLKDEQNQKLKDLNLKNQYFKQAEDLFVLYDYIYKLEKKEQLFNFSTNSTLENLKKRIEANFII